MAFEEPSRVSVDSNQRLGANPVLRSCSKTLVVTHIWSRSMTVIRGRSRSTALTERQVAPLVCRQSGEVSENSDSGRLLCDHSDASTRQAQ